MNKSKALAAIAALMTCMSISGSAFAFGAIAVDDERGQSEPGYGFATGKASREAAERAAMRQCRDSGNRHCKVVVWFKRCGAYAASSRYYGYGYGDTKRVAERNALDNCGRKSCRVIVAECGR